MDQRTQHKRDEVLQEMRRIERLRQGTLSEQYYTVGKKQQGPCYVLQGYQAGKHWSRRVAQEQLNQVRADIAGQVRFEELCRTFAEVTEQATIVEEQVDNKKSAGGQSRTVSRDRSIPEDDRDAVCDLRDAGYVGGRRRPVARVDAGWAPYSGGVLQSFHQYKVAAGFVKNGPEIKKAAPKFPQGPLSCVISN